MVKKVAAVHILYEDGTKSELPTIDGYDAATVDGAALTAAGLRVAASNGVGVSAKQTGISQIDPVKGFLSYFGMSIDRVVESGMDYLYLCASADVSVREADTALKGKIAELKDRIPDIKSPAYKKELAEIAKDRFKNYRLATPAEYEAYRKSVADNMLLPIGIQNSLRRYFSDLDHVKDPITGAIRKPDATQLLAGAMHKMAELEKLPNRSVADILKSSQRILAIIPILNGMVSSLLRDGDVNKFEFLSVNDLHQNPQSKDYKKFDFCTMKAKLHGLEYTDADVVEIFRRHALLHFDHTLNNSTFGLIAQYSSDVPNHWTVQQSHLNFLSGNAHGGASNNTYLARRAELAFRPSEIAKFTDPNEFYKAATPEIVNARIAEIEKDGITKEEMQSRAQAVCDMIGAYNKTCDPANKYMREGIGHRVYKNCRDPRATSLEGFFTKREAARHNQSAPDYLYQYAVIAEKVSDAHSEFGGKGTKANVDYYAPFVMKSTGMPLEDMCNEFEASRAFGSNIHLAEMKLAGIAITIVRPFDDYTGREYDPNQDALGDMFIAALAQDRQTTPEAARNQIVAELGVPDPANLTNFEVAQRFFQELNAQRSA